MRQSYWMPPCTRLKIKGPDGYIEHVTRRHLEVYVDDLPINGEYVARAQDSGQEWLLLIPEEAITPTAKVQSLSVPGQYYLVAFDSTGRGIRCSCPGYSNRQKCRHLRSSAMSALLASIAMMLEAGASLDEVWAHWRAAQDETAHLGARCARMALKASEVIAREEIIPADRLITLAGPGRRRKP